MEKFKIQLPSNALLLWGKKMKKTQKNRLGKISQFSLHSKNKTYKYLSLDNFVLTMKHVNYLLAWSSFC